MQELIDKGKLLHFLEFGRLMHCLEFGRLMNGLGVIDSDKYDQAYDEAAVDVINYIKNYVAGMPAEEQPTIESDIDRVAILRLCNEIEMIIVTACDTGYTLQDGDVKAIMKRTKAIRGELTRGAGTD